VVDEEKEEDTFDNEDIDVERTKGQSGFFFK
jgi:hypothetical protein